MYLVPTAMIQAQQAQERLFDAARLDGPTQDRRTTRHHVRRARLRRSR